MEQYQELVETVLRTGNHKPNRTGVDTVSSFGQSYKIDMQDGFPLLTTKDMSGFRWNSLIHELIWYFSGDEHIRDLREETSIWDAWADDEGRLETAYGRFWRRYPIPSEAGQLDGEAWPEEDTQWVNSEEDGRTTFDQLQYVIDTLNGDNPDRGPNSRRLVVNAWHPANAAVSTLPPCHFTYVFNVQGDELNVHLTQRSGDIALGVPFNIAGYAAITQAIAQHTGYELGEFSHTVVDAHIYAGKGERGAWYADNLDELQERLDNAYHQSFIERGKNYIASLLGNSPMHAPDPDELRDIKGWIEDTAPPAETDERGKPYDHIPGLLEQLSREPLDRPTLEIADKPIDKLAYEDFQLEDYQAHDGIDFGVAE